MSNSKPKGYIYIITNTLNGKYYIGSHCGSRGDYMGSGSALKVAQDKYGKHNFKKEVLYYCEDYLQQEEALLIALDAAANRDMYNLKNAALGIPKGHRFSEATKERMSESSKGELNPQYGQTGSKATCYGRTGARHPMYGKTHTDEVKQRLSKLSKGVKKPTTRCPHCGRLVPNHVLNRFHMDNCKHAPKVQ